jgi:hypothetical protein
MSSRGAYKGDAAIPWRTEGVFRSQRDCFGTVGLAMTGALF